MTEPRNPLEVVEEALETITKAEGPYGRDRLTHAENTITHMVMQARAALALVRKLRADAVVGWMVVEDDCPLFSAMKPPGAMRNVGPSDSMRRAIAELWGFDPETWPAHGNWQLAVTAGIALDKERIATLRAWVDDLQSGMFVNCVYCGHRYGPKETTPVSMADALREHIEFCPDHPMSALRAENERLRNRLKFHARADALRGSA